MISENEKISEINNELIFKLSTVEKHIYRSKLEIVESNIGLEEINEQKPSTNKKNSIDQQINFYQYQSKIEKIAEKENNYNIPRIILLKEDSNIELNSNQDGQENLEAPLLDNLEKNNDSKTVLAHKKSRHIREGSLLNEIIQLKKNEIIADDVFEEGFQKINRLNTEMKVWVRGKSDIDISTVDNTLEKALLNVEKNAMMSPDKQMRSLFKSKQLITPINLEEKKERKRTESKIEQLNPYEDFFILV